jgi:uncharacterized FAD-dependent dehydrogenase
MGYKKLQIHLPTDYSDDDIRNVIKRNAGVADFSFKIEKKSLDARKKNNIHWQISLIVKSKYIKGADYVPPVPLNIPYKKRREKVIVVGSGPAGFFAAHVLQQAGFETTIIERGSEVRERTKAVNLLNSKGIFSSANNFAFGEGGAGTFSDGKLTSRSKRISAERHFILQEYVKAGAPEEILYMAHPHIGTDNLKIIVANLRQRFLENGGEILFDTRLNELKIKNSLVKKVICDQCELDADYLILATGHSAYDTYRMLMRHGVQFKTKNFAIGHRIEHPQALINRAQWGREKLSGVKAADYRLTTKTRSGLPVYSFCMCPGGQVVPAAAYEHKSVVNGMSRYRRDGKFANAGIVAGVHPDMLLGHTATAAEILDWMDALEEQFFNFTNNYTLPAATAKAYISKLSTVKIGSSSYPLGLQSAPLYDMVPAFIADALAEGVKDFSRKIHGFERGLLMGLESKTSSPIQAVREKDGRSSGFDNLYIAGEGSGYAGGIISSAADGIKCALNICES